MTSGSRNARAMPVRCSSCSPELTLPDAATYPANTQRAVVVLPDGRRAQVTYLRHHSTKGRSTRWCWTPVSATMLEQESE